MNIGGNKNLTDFFQHYDLADEALQTKYKTKASEYYRNKVFILIYTRSCYKFMNI